MTSSFGVRLSGDERLLRLVRPAMRHNPRRAHLLVSTVLGKHLPVDPRVALATGYELGDLVAAATSGSSCAVLGFAETATALGHCVAERLGARYVHSTRRLVPGAPLAVAFQEEHSHATGHRLLPDDPELLASAEVAEVLVLVDDELSTGRTAANTIAAIHSRHPRKRYVVAALVDVRTPEDRVRLDRIAAELDVRIDVVALARGTVAVPAGLAAGAATVGEPPMPPCRGPATVLVHRNAWPAGVREGGRHGFGPDDVAAARAAAATVAGQLATKSGAGADVLVLGTEELMYAPALIAAELAAVLPSVRVSSTTRSPIVVAPTPGYPVADVVRFEASDDADGSRRRFAYNVGRRTDIVLVVDTAADGPPLWTGLVERLRERCDRLHVVVLPTYRPSGPQPLRGPAFGSYRADEVGWLLTDLSGVPLEAPTEEREEAVQSGGAHYAESLPIEYRPDAEYRALFERALRASVERVATAVGIVTELLLAERGPDAVLASLARAGTPIGILVRRWAHLMHGLDLPHYSVSIVRGRGIDEAALRWLAAAHDPSSVVFVDGWTGKGAIVRELRAAVTEANERLGTSFSPELAVLADPGSCVTTFGTREDFLVPSACLNSTVSGLVSRTVCNSRILPPGRFHGAKFYRELAADDVSGRFLDAVTETFGSVRDAVAAAWPDRQRGDRTPEWSGWRRVQEIADRHAIGDVNLVKPGVGETTRVLLRRVPWRVLVAPGAGAELDHVRLLAERRGVPVEEEPDLGYSCVGVIHPRYTRGATGGDGRSVAR